MTILKGSPPIKKETQKMWPSESRLDPIAHTMDKMHGYNVKLVITLYFPLMMASNKRSLVP